MRKSLTILAAASLVLAGCGTTGPKPYGAIPSPQQVEWQKMDRNMFMHFGPNTFSGKEWGDGTETEDMFNPTAMDCHQWARCAKAAGFKGIIITAKHHDGFCLWPNPVCSHTVAQSSWKDGKGDVLKELSEACRDEGLKFGVYISPWDRNDPSYGTPEYNDVFVKTLQSALGNYGEVFEQWFDGANGEGPNGKRQVYDWPLFHKTVLDLQPRAIMFSDVGPGCRWVGNERGECGRTCWSALDIEGFEPGSKGPKQDTLNAGNVHGKAWVPAETDVSIRPGWFWKERENSKVKSLQQLLKIYYESSGRNSLMLLNVPPDTRGLIHEIDSVRLVEFGQALEKIFSEDLAKGAKASATSVRGRKWKASNVLDDSYDSFWTTKDGNTTPTLTLDLGGVKTFNRVLIQEYIPLGQRVASFSIEAQGEDGSWKEIAKETTIGFKRIVLTQKTSAKAIRVNFLKSYDVPTINRVSLYMDDIYDENAVSSQSAKGVVRKKGESATIDLGSIKGVSGFTYAPIYKGEGGVVIEYDLEGSTDGSTWTKILSGKTFDNIVNNPIAQEVSFPETKVRYLRLTPLRTSNSSTWGASAFSPKE